MRRIAKALGIKHAKYSLPEVEEFIEKTFSMMLECKEVNRLERICDLMISEFQVVCRRRLEDKVKRIEDKLKDNLVGETERLQLEQLAREIPSSPLQCVIFPRRQELLNLLRQVEFLGNSAIRSTSAPHQSPVPLWACWADLKEQEEAVSYFRIFATTLERHLGRLYRGWTFLSAMGKPRCRGHGPGRLFDGSWTLRLLELSSQSFGQCIELLCLDLCKKGHIATAQDPCRELGLQSLDDIFEDIGARWSDLSWKQFFCNHLGHVLVVDEKIIHRQVELSDDVDSETLKHVREHFRMQLFHGLEFAQVDMLDAALGYIVSEGNAQSAMFVGRVILALKGYLHDFVRGSGLADAVLVHIARNVDHFGSMSKQLAFAEWALKQAARKCEKMQLQRQIVKCRSALGLSVLDFAELQVCQSLLCVRISGTLAKSSSTSLGLREMQKKFLGKGTN